MKTASLTLLVVAVFLLGKSYAFANVREACGNNSSCASCFNAQTKAMAAEKVVQERLNASLAKNKRAGRRFANEELCNIIYKQYEEVVRLASRAKSVCSTADVIPDLRRWSVEIETRSKAFVRKFTSQETYSQCLAAARSEAGGTSQESNKNKTRKETGTCPNNVASCVRIIDKGAVSNGLERAFYFKQDCKKTRVSFDSTVCGKKKCRTTRMKDMVYSTSSLLIDSSLPTLSNFSCTPTSR